ncbi:MAG: hypothetical protein MZV64_59445 [Ignavibacteriales bacterium]|nr:hypothetical protein [Ignavibacteriales bacterium]
MTSPPSKASPSTSRKGKSSACSDPNGAGKTTTISMLSTLYTPTSRRRHHRRAFGHARTRWRCATSSAWCRRTWPSTRT